MNIGIIGSGRLGHALGARLASAGHAIFFGGGHSDASRRAAEAVTGARHGTNAAAAEFGDVVVLAVPFSKIDEAIKQTEGKLAGTIVWSCVNALTPDLTGLAVGFDTSAAERVAARVVEEASARVVAALPPFAELLAGGELDFAGELPDVFVCGDDQGAKSEVFRLVTDLGARPVDAGPLVAARLVEPAMMLLVTLAYRGGTPRGLGLKMLEK